MLLGLLADPVPHCVDRSARDHDFVRIRSTVDRYGEGDLALELPMSKRRMLVSGSVYAQCIIERPGIGEEIFFSRGFITATALRKADHQPPHRFPHTFGALEEGLGDRMRGGVFLQDHAPLLKRMKEL